MATSRSKWYKILVVLVLVASLLSLYSMRVTAKTTAQEREAMEHTTQTASLYPYIASRTVH